MVAVEDCKHNNVDTEMMDYGYPDAVIGDYVDDWRETMVCQDCGATSLDGKEWEDE